MACLCLCSIAAAALLPGNTGLWGIEQTTPPSASINAFEIINTANSRWEFVPNEFFFDDVYEGYKCDIACTIPYYQERKTSDAEGWGFAPDAHATLPFKEGRHLIQYSLLAHLRAADISSANVHAWLLLWTTASHL